MSNIEQREFLQQIILSGDKSYDEFDGSDTPVIKDDQTIWQHVHLDGDTSQAWVIHKSNLDSVIGNALCAQETRPRSMKHKEGILVVLRGLNTNPGNDPEDMISVRVWLEKNRIITVRRRFIMATQDILSDLEDGQGPRTSGEFLIELVDKLADRIGDFVNGIEDELSDTEDKLEEIEHSELRSTLGSLRRQIASVRRYLSPQRDALDRLNHLETTIFSERDRQRLRDEFDRVSRYLEDLDLARERAVVLQEAFLSQIAQQQNERMYALSIVAAIFLPLGFLTGLLGINVGGMPGSDNPIAFWFVCFLSLGVAALIALIFKKLKWL